MISEWAGDQDPRFEELDRVAPGAVPEAAGAGGVAAAEPLVAYLSMEVGLDGRMPTYSGGLGVLAGDTLKAAADLGVPLVAVTLLHRKGYFRQSLSDVGAQEDGPARWSPEEGLDPMPQRVTVRVEGREVVLRAWLRRIVGARGSVVPLYFLDADLPENAESDRRLTDNLYGGDRRYRLSQEVILGQGGLRMLHALGHDSIEAYHMNEGHSALVTLGLLRKSLAEGLSPDEAVSATKARCVFTTHTPVPAGHDTFDPSLAEEVLGRDAMALLREVGAIHEGVLNMTYLSLNLSRYVNGVAMRHGQVSRAMFPGFQIHAITNGVHARSWVAPPFQALYDAHIPDWREESVNLRHAVTIPLDEVRSAHATAKGELLREIEDRTGRALDPGVLTLGFARRATPYKRADLLLSDPERLRAIAALGGGLQIVYAGKAHPRDEGGQAVIRRIHEVGRELGDDVPVVYLENYDMALGARLVSGVDVWVNTPRKPQEASGTSGMKAAMNGVPNLSILDGWWIEGHVEGVTGWSIGDRWDEPPDREREVESLYHKLADAVLPMYRRHPDEFAAMRRHSAALCGSFFNAQRMMVQYVTHAYRLPELVASRVSVPVGVV